MKIILHIYLLFINLFEAPVQHTHMEHEFYSMDSACDLSSRKIIDFLCVICKFVLNKPMQTECGCRIDEQCLKQCLAESGSDTIRCPGGLKGCNLVSLTVRDHMAYPDKAIEREITRTKRTCQLCKTTMLIREYENVHTNLENKNCCNLFVAPCPKCNKGSFDKETLKEHKNYCTEWKIHCTMKDTGCQFVGNASSNAEHMKTSDRHHIDLANNIVQPLLDSVTKLFSEATTLKNKHLTTKENVMRSSKASISTHLAVANCVQQRIERLPDSTQSSTRIVSTTTSNQTIARDPIRTMERELAEISTLAVSRNGILVWPLKNYRRCKSLALTGREEYVDSPPFKTSDLGYLLRVRAYPNGNMRAKGSHFSLYLVIMKSQYDEILSWPFAYSISLSILDQSNARRNVKTTIKPDRNNPGYDTPVQLNNTAGGLDEFISHTVLETPRYLVEDTIFIKAVVHTMSGYLPD